MQRHFTADRPRYGSAIFPILKSIIPEYIFAPSSACFPAGSRGTVYPLPPAPALSRPPSGNFMQSAASPQSCPSTATESANTSLIHCDTFLNFCKITTSSNLFQQAVAHIIMQRQNPFLQHSKRKSIPTGIHFRATLSKVCRRIYSVLQ